MTFEYGNMSRFVQETEHNTSNILVTGVTGFLGGHYLAWRSQLPGKIFVLVRAEDHAQGWERVYSSLQLAAQSYEFELGEADELAKKIVCVLGDMNLPNCGVSAEDMQVLQESEISTIWHCAANMAFLPKDREKLNHTNVIGTTALMTIGKQVGVERFVYISTAYTAGHVSGDVKEELHDGNQVFANCYEESKHAAEHAVANFCLENELKWTILRPSMVMGPIASKNSGGTRFGAYGFVRSLYEMQDVLSRVHNKIRMEIPEHTTVNLIPVDQVLYDMLYIESIGFGEQSIYHLSNTVHDSVRTTFQSFDDAVGTDTLAFINERDTPATSLEQVFDKGTRFSKGYLYSEKVFVRSLPPHAEVFNNTVLEECMANYLVELKKDEEAFDFERETVTSWDGQRLSAYSRGDEQNPPLIFINAYGMPLQFSTPFSRRISRKFRFITWDSRWVPDTTQEFEVEKCNSLTHAKDLIAVMDHFAIDKCVIVGWSSGAQVCLRTMREFKDRIECGVLLNSGVSLLTEPPVEQTEYQQSLRSLFPKMAASRRASKLYCDLIYGNSNEAGLNDQNAIGSMLNSLDTDLMGMTSAPFKDTESLFRYSNMLSLNFEEDADAYTTGNDLPVLVYGSEEDEVTHPDVARGLAKALTNSSLHITEEGTHFAQYTEESVAKVVMKFIQEAVNLPASSVSEK
jgi:thioester reductase-like protein/pimeloyl-ACP methyl ester carboxylesterase